VSTVDLCRKKPLVAIGSESMESPPLPLAINQEGKKNTRGRERRVCKSLNGGSGLGNKKGGVRDLRR
jgi:hypothetical protein